MKQLSPQTQAFIREHRTDNVRALALKANKYPDIDMTAALTQIAGRQAAAEKIPSWEKVEAIWYPAHLPLEQCSSEVTARYKARLLHGDSLTDLTGGFGIDCSFLAANFQTVTYVERQEELCEIAAHNFPLLGLSHIRVRHEDGMDHLRAMPPADCIFLDPARRNEHGGKTVAIADCEPNVAKIEGLLLEKAQRVMVKLSPMLDLTLALKELPHAQEAHIVSVDNECKELLLILGQTPPEEVPIHCVNLSSKALPIGESREPLPEKEEQTFTFTREQELRSGCVYAGDISAYLYEPNASLLKGGAYKSLTSVYPLSKLHPNSHLYTSDELIKGFPGRAFQVTGSYGFNKKEIKEAIGDLKKANLTIRNFPSSTAELRKRLKLTEGGDTYLFATTLADGKKQLIRCKRIK